MQPDPLAQLRDIQLPVPISWWPLAPGWWVLIIFAACLLGWCVLTLMKRHRANLYRRQALINLAKINTRQDLTSTQKLVLVFETLKRTIKTAYPEQNFSSRDLNAFVDFLQCSCSAPVFEDLPEDLNAMLYGKSTETETNNSREFLEKLLVSANNWINNHYSQSKLKAETLC